MKKLGEHSANSEFCVVKSGHLSEAM